MRRTQTLFIAGVLWACASSAIAAEVQSYQYETRNPRTREDENAYTLTVERLPDGHLKFARTLTGEDIHKYEDFVLDAQYDTLKWSTKRENKDTDYIGSKEGRTLTLKGTLKGEGVDKTVELEDDKPFYFSPKFNLQKFVLSEAQEIEFWTLRKDELTPYLMVAKKDGTKKLKINGQEIETVVVKYSPAGKFARYYRRTYYYRASDGVFVQRKSPMGSITRLVGP